MACRLAVATVTLTTMSPSLPRPDCVWQLYPSEFGGEQHPLGRRGVAVDDAKSGGHRVTRGIAFDPSVYVLGGQRPIVIAPCPVGVHVTGRRRGSAAIAAIGDVECQSGEEGGGGGGIPVVVAGQGGTVAETAQREGD